MAKLLYRGIGGAVLSCLMLACALVLAPAAASCQSPEKVEEVGIRLDLSGGMVGAETLGQLESALLDTVEVALLDQLDANLDYILRHQSAVAQTLGEVIAPVLERRGFVLEELMLEPGRVTRLLVRLHLAEQRVREFAVHFYLLGNTSVVEELTAADEEMVAAELYATLARTPYRDETWLSGLVTDTVEAQLARMPEYAGFDHVVLVQPGDATTVAVAFTPLSSEPALSDYKLHLRSLTIPNLRLHPVREQAVYYLQALLGAPLSFIEAKLPQLTQALYQHLVNTCTLDDQQAEAYLAVTVSGCVLDADLRVDSGKYLLSGRARLALWDNGPGAYESHLSVRAGMQPAVDWPLFFDASIHPGEEEIYPALCLGHLVDYGLLGAGWDFKADAVRLLGQYDFSPQLYLALDAFADGGLDQLSEISVHYRVRDIYELQLRSSFDGEVYAAIGAVF